MTNMHADWYFKYTLLKADRRDKWMQAVDLLPSQVDLHSWPAVECSTPPGRERLAT